MPSDSTPLPRTRTTEQYNILVLEFIGGKLGVPRAKKNENPCSECSRSHQRCFIEEPFSPSLCRKCWKQGRQSCPSQAPKRGVKIRNVDDDGSNERKVKCDERSKQSCNNETFDAKFIQSADGGGLEIIQGMSYQDRVERMPREHALDVHSQSSSNVIPAVLSNTTEPAPMPWTNCSGSVNQTVSSLTNVERGEEPLDWSEFQIFFGHMT
ncbi:hypothetical protein BD410DRAFT_176839 [Rickenella mellea]|uniref:Uncharacterized protein n=1 Tax=Rickenella mellea TaxID=50990 RepID=A0A4Y7Q833_9AGAM|nr:hypothetical protein BD410DRAFT_176839 [Rickenella mellea]